MVDAGNSPEHVQAYLAAVEESGFCQPDFVALTHSHWDHCFGLASLPMPSIACVQTRQSLEMVSRLQWTPDALAENVRKGIVPQLCAPRIQLHFSRSGEHSGGTAHYGFFREHDAGLGELHL